MLQSKSGKYVCVFLHIEIVSLPHHRVAVLPVGAEATDLLHLEPLVPASLHRAFIFAAADQYIAGAGKK